MNFSGLGFRAFERSVLLTSNISVPCIRSLCLWMQMALPENLSPSIERSFLPCRQAFMPMLLRASMIGAVNVRNISDVSAKEDPCSAFLSAP